MNDWPDPLSAAIGAVTVSTTNHGGHPPEYWAEQVVNRLIFVGDKLPEPIKAQALAYREQILWIVLEGIKKAVENDRIYRK
jgi:hypothetical protein